MSGHQCQCMREYLLPLAFFLYVLMFARLVPGDIVPSVVSLLTTYHFQV